jgi:hypothetical protein
MKEVSGIRWRWLRFMYLYTILGAGGFGLAILLMPERMKTAFRWPPDEPIALSIVGSVYLAFGVLSFFGLREPLKFVPVLLVQLCYKLAWFVCAVFPLLLSGRFPSYAVPTAVIFATYVVGDLIAIPFSYVFRSHRGPSIQRSQEPDSKKPEADSLRVQLTEMNNRGRWYSSELWQVPFAFLGVTGLIITQVADKGIVFLGVAFGASALFGVFVLIHMFRIRTSEIRAIKHLQDTEEALHLPPTAKTRGGVKIFQVAMIVATAAYTLTAVGLLWSAKHESSDERNEPNQAVQPTGDSRLAEETNRTSSASGFCR